MNVYETPEGIDTGTAVIRPLPTTQPKDTSKNPIAFGVSFRKLRRKYLSGWPAPTKHGPQRLAVTNSRTDIMLTSGRTPTAILLSSAVERCGYRIVGQYCPLIRQHSESLVSERNMNMRPFGPWGIQRVNSLGREPEGSLPEGGEFRQP